MPQFAFLQPEFPEAFVIDHLTARGLMDPRLLYESPFTDLDTSGVEGVFEPAAVVRLVQVLREVEARSAA